MNQWKEAFWLSRYELKQSITTYFLLFICLLFSLLFIVPTMGDYLEDHTLGIDVFFILIFTVIIQWCRPKAFRSQDSESGLWVSKHLIMLNQLPVQKGIIIKHRLLSYILTSLPFHIAFLALLYILTPILRDSMSIGSFLAFSVFWLCFSIYFGCTEPASEAGFRKFSVVLRNLLLGIMVTFTVIVVFHKVLPQKGFVHWVMTLSSTYPLSVTFLSILLAGLGIVFWIRNMRKKMNKMDYY